MSNKSFKKKIAIIPARGGSKEIPKKNVGLLAGMLLIVCFVEVALKLKYIVQMTLLVLRSVLIKNFKNQMATLIVPKKRDNACGWKGLEVEPLGQGHIHRIKRWVKDGNKTVLTTYPINDEEVLLKSQMSENVTSGSVRGLIAASGRKWL